MTTLGKLTQVCDVHKFQHDWHIQPHTPGCLSTKALFVHVPLEESVPELAVASCVSEFWGVCVCLLVWG